MWMASYTGSARGGFWRFLKSQLRRVLRSEEEGWLSLARCGRVAGATCDGGGAHGKVIIERLCISLPYVETFDSKVIKGFVPELRSRYVFFEFQDSYVLCIYVMNILCTFHTYSSTGILQVIVWLIMGYIMLMSKRIRLTRRIKGYASETLI